MAVSATSTINTEFGSKVYDYGRTGIIFNNLMDDFSIPNRPNSFNLAPGRNNDIAPGRRPRSSMIPSIVVSKSDELVAVIGGAGGSRIISSVLMVDSFFIL